MAVGEWHDGEVLARWTPATDLTITAYQVHVQWSPTEWRDYTVLAGPTPILRIGALQNDLEYEHGQSECHRPGPQRRSVDRGDL